MPLIPDTKAFQGKKQLNCPGKGGSLPVTTLSPPRWLREKHCPEEGCHSLVTTVTTKYEKTPGDWGANRGHSKTCVARKKTQELFRHPVVTPSTPLKRSVIAQGFSSKKSN